jgi:hypothetical protein
MMPLAALFCLLGAPGVQDPAPADRKTVEQLITDLGSSDEQRRERAETELKKMGTSALPALRQAARSDDAERALRARRLLVGIVHEERGKEEKDASSPSPRMALVYEDWAKGIRFALAPSGKVTLTVPEEDKDAGRREFKTYQADSIQEFKTKYPDIARKYEIDKFLSFREMPMGDEQLRKRLGLREDDNQGPSESQGHRFGILVRPVDATLASQLQLQQGEGVVVRRVEPGSPAEQSGVKPFDVIVKVDGEKVQAQKFREFRKRLQESMSLDILRGGKQEKIHVKPPQEKEEKKPKAR